MGPAVHTDLRGQWSFFMAFDYVKHSETKHVVKATPIPQRDAADDMIALGHMAGPRPVTRRRVNGPIPREARRLFLIGVGLVVLLALVVYLRAPA